LKEATAIARCSERQFIVSPACHNNPIGDCNLPFACFRKRLDEQSRVMPNVIMSFLTLWPHKETPLLAVAGNQDPSHGAA
jgi:hypothetical protein